MQNYICLAHKKNEGIIVTIFFIFCIVILSITEVHSRNMNFLLIIIDDLRPALGCYGDQNAYSPNIDSLAKKGILFKNAFVQQSLCAPSRNSFLTSRRPDTLHLYDFYSYWRTFAGNFTTLPQFFKESGYYTMSIGKVFHPGISSNFSDDQPYSWSETPFHPPTEKYKNAKVCPDKSSKQKLKKNLVCPVNPKHQPGGTLPDMESTQAARKFLKKTRNISQPFFLALGYHKPHIPLKYPAFFKKYHPLENVVIPNWRYRPSKLPTVAWNPWSDIRERDDVEELNISFPYGFVPDSYNKIITQSYHAAITYIDDLIGQVISELKESNQFDKTIITLIGDHGWSLSEHGEWSKYSNYEVAVKVPFIIRVPGLTDMGKDNSKTYHTSKDLVELVDLFPTLVELAGLKEVPQCTRDSRTKPLCTEGTSVVPLIEINILGQNFTTRQFKRWKRGAFSQYPRPGVFPTLHPNSDKPKLADIHIMGYSIRTKRYRYTEWVEFSNMEPDWGKVIAQELYDHFTDINEMKNLIGEEVLTPVVTSLKSALKSGWEKSKPHFI